MKLTKNTHHNVAVKVNNGSGTLLNIGEKAYVLTSYHCLEGQKEHLRNFDETVTYKSIGSSFDEEKDIALLRVKTSVEYAVKGTTDYSVGDPVIVYGFPIKGEKTGTPMNAKVSKVADGLVIETDLTYGNGAVNEKEQVINRIWGWSGSAVFKETAEGDLYLIGIIDSVTDKELTYQSIRCQTLETVLEFIDECELGSFEVVKKIESDKDKEEGGGGTTHNYNQTTGTIISGNGSVVNTNINGNITGVGMVTGGTVTQTINANSHIANIDNKDGGNITFNGDTNHNYNDTKETIFSGNVNKVIINEQEENLQQKLKDELSQFSFGNMVFDVPKKIFLNELKKVTLRISKNKISKYDLEEENYQIEKEVKISSFMSAKLMSSDFEIMALNEEEQIIDDYDFTEWKWVIETKKEKKRGVIYLRITIRIPLSSKKEEKKDLPVFEKNIDILVLENA